MSTAVATTAKNQQVATKKDLKTLLDQPGYRKRFEELLKGRAAQFCATLIQVTQRSKALSKCEPNSIIASSITAAALDLPIDPNLGFAHIVPYGEQAQFQLGYKGFIQLALRSGQYAKMNAKCVNADAFGGYDDVGDPIILWDKLDETKPPVGYAFAWKTVTGFTKVIYWTKEKVEAHAKRYSQAYKKGYETPWKTNFDAMALKTVIKDGVGHWGIMSIELRTALVADQSVQKKEGEFEYPDNLNATRASVGGETIDIESEHVTDGGAAEGQDTPSGKLVDIAAKQAANTIKEDKSADKTPEKTAEKVAEKPADKATPKPTETTASNPATGTAGQQLSEKVKAAGIPEAQFCEWASKRYRLAPVDSITGMEEGAPSRVARVLAEWEKVSAEIKADLIQN